MWADDAFITIREQTPRLIVDEKNNTYDIWAKNGSTILRQQVIKEEEHALRTVQIKKLDRKTITRPSDYWLLFFGHDNFHCII
ncbi:hypothetical protein [Paenibacillus sp. WC2504]|uniref:hypothetical protein n=1 Tax=Paenibacillus sp. WC2504 TaxID=3461403 RepID=UPI0040466E59